ncbi:MAG: MoaD/ThiS family protein [Planctomycetota bacterium]
MEIEVLLFASLADALGQPSLRTPVTAHTTAAALLAELALAYPQLAASLRHTRVARDARFLEADEFVLPARELALIPPVSGG